MTIIEQGEVMWTDDVFRIAKENNAYDYVTIPNDEKMYKFLVIKDKLETAL